MRINWILPAANMSGGTKSNRLIAEAMVRRGHAVNIIYSTAGRRSPGLRHPRRWLKWWIRKREERLNPPRHHLEISTANLIPVDHSPIRAEDVPDGDVVIGTWWETMEWIRDWPESKGKKAYFVRGHEIWVNHPERVRATYHFSAQKFVISSWLQQVMEDEYDDPNAILVPNGVDRVQFDADPRSKQPLPTIGLLWSCKPIKGVETAFEAIRLVQEQVPKLRIILFGSEPLDGSFFYPHPANIEFHHLPQQGLLADIYRSADCWVVSSTTEGFGMPGLEAAAGRCPIVSTLCGGPEDYVVDGETGYLVEVGDARGMAEAILKVVGQSEERWRAMSEASYLKSLEFDWDKSAEILEGALLGYVGGNHEFDGEVCRGYVRL